LKLEKEFCALELEFGFETRFLLVEFKEYLDEFELELKATGGFGFKTELELGIELGLELGLELELG